MKAAIISDIYGAQARSPHYMERWRVLLHERGYAVETIYLDALCPDAYRQQPFSMASTHARFLDGGIDEAILALRILLAERAVDLLLGFSFGGYLACLARPLLAPGAAVVCISATRLRFAETLAGCAPVHALFGANDPNRPSAALRLDGACHEYLLAGAGHDIYLDQQACSFVLDQLG